MKPQEKVLTDEEMNEHLLWTQLNSDLQLHGIFCNHIEEYILAIQKRKPVFKVKIIFEIRNFNENIVKLAVKEAENVDGRTQEFVSRDPFGRFFRTSYDKETGKCLNRAEIKGTQAVVIVFKSVDGGQLWGALFLNSELSIIPWKQAVNAVPLLKIHNWIPYGDTYPEHLKIKQYILNTDEKQTLFNEIPLDTLQRFLQDRDMFIVTNSKEELIKRMVLMSFSYEDMKVLFTLAGRKTD